MNSGSVFESFGYIPVRGSGSVIDSCYDSVRSYIHTSFVRGCFLWFLFCLSLFAPRWESAAFSVLVAFLPVANSSPTLRLLLLLLRLFLARARNRQ